MRGVLFCSVLVLAIGVARAQTAEIVATLTDEQGRPVDAKHVGTAAVTWTVELKREAKVRRTPTGEESTRY
ncbi:MAG TPA: hypothetical protein VF814_00250 [Casimicrobiaceae bacterium]